MSTTVKAGWLKDGLGNKFAPKTLFSQVQADNGVTLEEALEAAANSGGNVDIDALELITVADIDAICGATILNASEVMF